MKLLGSTKSKISKNENGEIIPNSEITEVLLVHCNIVNNNYQRNLRVLYTCVTNNRLVNLNISLKNFIFLKTFDSKFSNIEVWLIDQDCNPLEIEDKKNITLVI